MDFSLDGKKKADNIIFFGSQRPVGKDKFLQIRSAPTVGVNQIVCKYNTLKFIL